MMTRLMTSLCPSNGAVNRFTRTHGREREPCLDSRRSRDLKVVNGVKDHSRKHTCEWVHVNEFTAIHNSHPFTAFHGLCVPVNRFTCDSVHSVFTPLAPLIFLNERRAPATRLTPATPPCSFQLGTSHFMGYPFYPWAGVTLVVSRTG